MSRRGLYTIAPHGKFLEVLADRVLDGTLLGGWDRSGPFWLSDVTIILPTRRARLSLAETFAERRGGAALLPDIRTFGGESGDDDLFLPPVGEAAPKPAMSLLERRLTLSHLVRQFALSADGFASPPNAAEILWLADSLGTLIDDLTIEEVKPAALRELVPEALAANWQDIVRFLEIALSAWPEVLASTGKIDASRARNERLDRQAETAPLLFGDRPVIAAGSTGSIPATARLLAAIAALPRGAIVLPGLDTRLTAEQHERMLTGATTQGHSQYGLMRLLRRLGAGVADVEELAGDPPRTQMLRASLAAAEETAGWTQSRRGADLDAALAGLSVIAAPNADLEARAIALAARQALIEGKSVGIVSRDQTLARRISAELERHAITVDDPAGTPLYQSAAGRLARQALAATSGFGPVDVVALLRNGAVTLGLGRPAVRRLADELDLRLRGQRVRPGLDGLDRFAGTEPLHDLLDRLGAALQPLAGLDAQPTIDAPALIAALSRAIEALIGDADIPGRLELRGWADEIAAASNAGAAFPPANLDGVLKALMAGVTVQTGERRRDDIHIWGELEARLQNPDLMILAGVNEDSWPAPADPGPWMSRGMRVAVGLEPPERQQGQAAHDFEMAAGNADVLIAYAARMGNSPALPSRLLQRLDAYVGDDAAKALRARGAVWLDQARRIDFADRPQPAMRPLPSPPADERPRRLSVTEIEPLMRSPYDIYARHVLRLRKLEPLGAEPGARDRGTIIHKVFEQFVEAGFDFAAPDAAARMMALARVAFSELDMIGERRDIWLERFELAAEQFIAFERRRGVEIAERAAERKGELIYPMRENFVLVGKADRIDRRLDDTLEILDFKTGGVPQPKDMTAFDAPQLLLEAAMARAGAFPGIARLDSSALIYIKIGLGPSAFQVRPFKLRAGMSLMAAVDEIERRMQGHVDAFLLHDHLPMAARIRPRVETGRKPYPGDYDHLARTDEWTLTAGVDDP